MSPKLTQDIDGAEFVENFLIATVVAILTRWYLELTAIRNWAGRAVSPMLWGGCPGHRLLMNLLIDRRVLNSSAVMRRRFVHSSTSWGNSSRRTTTTLPADHALISDPHPTLFGTAPSSVLGDFAGRDLGECAHLVSDGVIHGLLPQTRDRVQEYLANANQGEIEPLLRMMGVNSVEPSQEATRETLLARMRIKRRTGSLATFISGHKWFWPVVMGYMALAALATLLFLAVIIAAWLGYVEALGIEDKESLLDVSSLGLTVSSLIAGLMAFAGLLSYPFSHRRALRFFHYSLLVSIFLVQFFQFEIYQLGAVANLVFNVIALKSIDLRVDNAAALDEAPNA